MKRILSFFLAIATMFCAVNIQTYAASSQVQIDRANEGKQNPSEDIDYWNTVNVDQSFAHAIRIAVNYANRQFSAGNSIGGTEYGNSLNASNIGVFFGYSSGEVEYDYTYSGENLRSSNSDASSSVTYSVKSIKSTLNGHGDMAGYDYYCYGLFLNLIGFDEVGTTDPSATRQAYGTIATIAYTAATSVNTIFDVCFDILWATNPFVFFKDIDTFDDGKTELDNIYSNATDLIGKDANVTGTIGVLQNFFSKVWNSFSDFAWSVSIPLSILFIIIAFFLTRRGRYSFGSNIKKLVVKVVFVAMGIPILGSAYTQVLDGMRTATSVSNNYLSQAVGYTFVDFRSWVETSHLKPVIADTTSWSLIIQSMDTGSVSTVPVISAANIVNLRKTCYAINQSSGLFENTGGDLTVSQTGVLLKDYIYNTAAGSVLSTNSSTSASDVSDIDRSTVASLLDDYKNGTTYLATSFNSTAIAKMQAKQSCNNTSFGDMLALSFDKYSFSQNAERKIQWLQGKIDAGSIQYDPDDVSKTTTYADVAKARFSSENDFAGVGYNIWNDGKLTVKSHYGFSGNNTSSGSDDDYEPSVDENNSYVQFNQSTSGLSTMSMYTYLTSEFTRSGITAYGNSPTEYTHKAHYAVNLVGSTPVMQFAFLANTVAILLGYFALAVVFVFQTGFSIIFKGFQLMGHVLLAAAGFYKSIGTCICTVINMIAQLFITVVFFSLMTDFMFMLSSIFDNFFTQMLANVFNQTVSGMRGNYSLTSAYIAEVMTTLSSFIATFVIVFFVCFAARWRSVLMNSINSSVEEVVGTLLGVNLSGAADGGMGSLAKSALADTKSVAGVVAMAGAGAAATNAIDEIKDSFRSDESEVTAADAAVEPTKNAAFDGGSGMFDNDEDIKEEGMDVLENGLPDKDEVSQEDSNNVDSDASDTGATTDDSALNNNQSDTTRRVTLSKSADNSGGASSKARSIQRAELDGEAQDTLERTSSAKSNDASDTSVQTANEQPQDAAEDNNDEVQDVETSDAEVETNDETPQSGVSFDSDRGVVLTKANEDGTARDIAIGFNGVSVSSVDENGNKSVTSIGKNGYEHTRANGDGSSEIQSVAFDGLSSSMSVEKTDADGNSEVVTTGLNGTTNKRTEVAANGATTTTTTNTDGTQSIEVNNPETGYQSVTMVSADGSSAQTENINGVETVTNRDADDNIISKESTSIGLNGQTITSRFEANEDGSVVRTVSNGSIITKTTDNADGSRSVVQSTVQANGSIVETTSDFNADGAFTGEQHTVLKSADGMTVLGESVSNIQGADSEGDYVMSTVTTAAGTVETKDYGNGHTVTTETAMNGDTAVTEKFGNNSYRVVETDASTGEVTTTDIKSNNKGVNGISVVRNADGNTVGTNTVTTDANGNLSYHNVVGGTMTISDENGAKTVAMSYGAGGSNTEVSGSESVVTTMTDGLGGTTTATRDTNTGSLNQESVWADGTTVQESFSNGVAQSSVSYSSGMSATAYSDGKGNSAVTYSDNQGNSSKVVSENGNVVLRTGTSSTGGSYVQKFNNADGSWTTDQTMTSGDKTHTVAYSDGDFERTISYANGAQRVEKLDNGRLNINTRSVSGIETSAMYNGSTSSATVSTNGVVMTERTDHETGSVVRDYMIDGQRYSTTVDADGNSRTTFTLTNGSRAVYKVGSDGTQTNIIRSNGISRVETIDSNGESSVSYTDIHGRDVTKDIGIMETSFVETVEQFADNVQAIRDNMNTTNYANAENFHNFEVAAPRVDRTMTGMKTSVETTNGTMNLTPGVSSAMTNDAFNQLLFESAVKSTNVNLGSDDAFVDTLNGLFDSGKFGRNDAMTDGSTTVQ